VNFTSTRKCMMRSLRSLAINATVLLWILLSVSCAGLLLISPPARGQRTLEIAADFPGTYYQWKRCTKHFLWKCTEFEFVRETDDWTKPEVRKELIDQGYVCVPRGQTK
jgi:hypothetical protein